MLTPPNATRGCAVPSLKNKNLLIKIKSCHAPSVSTLYSNKVAAESPGQARPVFSDPSTALLLNIFLYLHPHKTPTRY
ncbi:hypothetical protein RIF29_06676 [Crotalaria pallida]|uniref:Uncharacterized protein n=1 Tax=Crotalaria pallida TaxID=3830 RepID=A0AAN9J504_CROPI